MVRVSGDARVEQKLAPQIIGRGTDGLFRDAKFLTLSIGWSSRIIVVTACVECR
jgi:hypothetical protein